MQMEEELMEMVGKMETSVLSPLEDTIMQLKQAWEDPAGKVFIDRLEFHRAQIMEIREKVIEAAQK